MPGMTSKRLTKCLGKNSERNDEILEMYDYLAEKIARYYIDNHYLNE